MSATVPILYDPSPLRQLALSNIARNPGLFNNINNDLAPCASMQQIMASYSSSNLFAVKITKGDSKGSYLILASNIPGGQKGTLLSVTDYTNNKVTLDDKQDMTSAFGIGGTLYVGSFIPINIQQISGKNKLFTMFIGNAFPNINNGSVLDAYNLLLNNLITNINSTIIVTETLYNKQYITDLSNSISSENITVIPSILTETVQSDVTKCTQAYLAKSSMLHYELETKAIYRGVITSDPNNLIFDNRLTTEQIITHLISLAAYFIIDLLIPLGR